jgi:hypothetical protein
MAAPDLHVDNCRYEPGRGRHGVATRPIQVGEILLEERPIAAAPRYLHG